MAKTGLPGLDIKGPKIDAGIGLTGVDIYGPKIGGGIDIHGITKIIFRKRSDIISTFGIHIIPDSHFVKLDSFLFRIYIGFTFFSQCNFLG